MAIPTRAPNWLVSAPMSGAPMGALRIRSVGAMVQEQPHQLDGALVRGRVQEPSARGTRLCSILEQQRRGGDRSSVHRMVQRGDGMKVLVRRLGIREPRSDVTAKHIQVTQECGAEHVDLRAVVE